MTEASDRFSAWVCLEMMGHRKEWGRVSEVTIAGTLMLRMDSFRNDGSDEPVMTVFVPPASIYAMTIVPESAARAQVETYQPHVLRQIASVSMIRPEEDLSDLGPPASYYDPEKGEPPF